MVYRWSPPDGTRPASPPPESTRPQVGRSTPLPSALAQSTNGPSQGDLWTKAEPSPLTLLNCRTTIAPSQVPVLRTIQTQVKSPNCNLSAIHGLPDGIHSLLQILSFEIRQVGTYWQPNVWIQIFICLIGEIERTLWPCIGSCIVIQ